MIKRTSLLLLFFLLFSHIAVCGQKKEVVLSPQDEEYIAVIEKVKSGDKEVDFLDLRVLYTKTQFYAPYADEESKELRVKVIETFKKGNYKKTLKLSQEVFEKDYLDMNMHFMCMMSYKNLEDSEREEYHKFVLNSLIDSIVSFGDGRSPETAYNIISTREEEFILSTLGYTAIKREEIRTKKHAFDKIFAKSLEESKKKILYFNKDMPNKWLNETYSGQMDPDVKPKKKSGWQKFKENYITYEGLD